jgi:hypothetical protein
VVHGEPAKRHGVMVTRGEFVRCPILLKPSVQTGFSDEKVKIIRLTRLINQFLSTLLGNDSFQDWIDARERKLEPLKRSMMEDLE